MIKKNEWDTFRMLLLLILICAAVSSEALAESIRWIYSYEDSLRLASRQDKPIMVGFYTTWCMYCRKLDETTYVDNAVVDLSKDFVCLKVDGEKRRDIAYGYGIGKFPTILFLDPAGRVIWREFGYRDPVFLARRMQEVLTVFRNSKAGDPYIRKAFDEARGGRIDEGIATLDAAVAMYPKDARLYAARGSLYQHKGDLDAALRDFDMSLLLNPSDDGVHTMRGMIHYQRRDPAKAMDDFNNAIFINRWGLDAYIGRGIIYLENKDPDAALKNLNSAILINPNKAAAYFYRSIAYMFLGQYDKSWDDLHFIERRGFKADPKFIAELRRLSGREE